MERSGAREKLVVEYAAGVKEEGNDGYGRGAGMAEEPSLDGSHGRHDARAGRNAKLFGSGEVSSHGDDELQGCGDVRM